MELEPFEWDKRKSERCRQERGFGFEIVYEFDFATASILEDLRRDYGERRFRAFGFIANEAFAVVFTTRNGRIRIISVRRASAREVIRHG